MRIVTPQFQKSSNPSWEYSVGSHSRFSITEEWVECPLAKTPEPQGWDRVKTYLTKLVNRL